MFFVFPLNFLFSFHLKIVLVLSDLVLKRSGQKIFEFFLNCFYYLLKDDHESSLLRYFSFVSDNEHEIFQKDSSNYFWIDHESFQRMEFKFILKMKLKDETER